MKDIILTIVILVILGSATTYIIKAKKRGEVCIGCPHAKQCAKGEHKCKM